jgi:hypothetical protein
VSVRTRTLKIVGVGSDGQTWLRIGPLGLWCWQKRSNSAAHVDFLPRLPGRSSERPDVHLKTPFLGFSKCFPSVFLHFLVIQLIMATKSLNFYTLNIKQYIGHYRNSGPRVFNTFNNRNTGPRVFYNTLANGNSSPKAFYNTFANGNSGSKVFNTFLMFHALCPITMQLLS